MGAFLRAATFLGAAGAAVVLTASGAEAQQLGGQRWVPAGSEDGVLETEGADPRVPWTPFVGVLLGYANEPVVLVTLGGAGGADDLSVDHLMAADLVASVAVWRGLEVGTGLPVWFAAPPSGFSDGEVSVGDASVRLGYRLRLDERTSVALHVPTLLPTSSTTNVLGLGLTVRPTAAVLHRVGPFEFLGNASYHARFPEGEQGFTHADELSLRLGARWALDRIWRTGLVLDVGATTALADVLGPNATLVEPRVGLERWFGGRVRVTAFGGLGLTTTVGSPLFRAGLAVAYGDNPAYRPRPAPSSGDRDGDGIEDGSDGCPNAPEDLDGFEDDDGCPDLDDDQDGVPDVRDKCPNAPQASSDDAGRNGCPDLVRLERDRITLLQPIAFDPTTDRLEEASYAVLEEVAGILRVNPSMRVRVEAHTAAPGTAEQNQVSSERRAYQVQSFLIARGARSVQLEAKGFGNTRPIDDSQTEEGRARNRRIEFVVLEAE